MSPQQPGRAHEADDRLDDLDLATDDAPDVQGGDGSALQCFPPPRRTLDAILSTATLSL